ncbi:MAG: RNA polymerase sigma-70 factor [Bacteroidales bacterium]|nr:RNA polymerase sigma-70 factor [Bacteroidales bacterium]
MTDNEEIKCIKAFAQGNTRAFELLFLNYQPKLVAFIDGFIKDTEEARDMSQDIFMRLWERREACCEIRSFKAFLFKTAKFSIYNYYDHQLVNNKFVEQMLYAPEGTVSADESLFAKELQGLIDQTVKNMPEQRRRVFEMSREEGLSNEEIAQLLGISKRTVENHITTALAALRKITLLAIFLFGC